MGEYVQKPCGEADQEKCEDDGTDRKEKRKEGGRKGRALKSNQQQNLSDCA